MTGDISAIGVDLINSYMHTVIGVFALVGGLLYLFVQHKSATANPGAVVSYAGFVEWAVMCGAIPVCFAFVCAAFVPKLLSALHNYTLLPAVYGVFHVYYTIWEKILPKLREYFALRK